MEPIANPAFNDQFVGQLIATHPFWAIAIVLVQLLLIPIFRQMLKAYTAKVAAMADDKKRIVDLETEIRKKNRDIQYDKLEKKVDENRIELKNEIKELNIVTQHKDEELTNSINGLKNAIDRLFDKLEKIDSRMNNRIVVDK